MTNAIIEDPYTRIDDETGEEEEVMSHRLVLKSKEGNPQMAVDETLTLTIDRDPTEWRTVQGKFGESKLAYFKTESGVSVKCFIGEKDRSAVFGETLWDAFGKMNEGDTFTIQRIAREVKSGAWKGTLFACYKITKQ